VAAFIQLVQSAFTTFWVPTAYRWHKEHRNMKIYVFVSQLVLFIFTIFFFGLLFTKQFIVLILSRQYSDAQYVIGLLALTPVLYTISETTTLGIVFSGKSYYNIWVSLIAFIPNIILNFLLIKPWGTVGAAISTATAYLLFFMGRTFFSWKCGFSIPSANLTINCVLLFIAGILSSLRTNISYVLVFGVFLLCLLLQRGFYSTLYDVIKHPDQWNLE
jgi:O-antigen/teichoic acid export membrane protein